MSDEIDDVVDNVKQGATWLRILLMIGFYVVLYVVGVVVVFVTLAQALFSIFTGSDNLNLRQLGASLSEYVTQILRYVTYNSESRPFPFNPFPVADGDTETDDVGEPAVTASKSAKKDSASTSTQNPASQNGPSSAATEKPASGKADIKPAIVNEEAAADNKDDE